MSEPYTNPAPEEPYCESDAGQMRFTSAGPTPKRENEPCGYCGEPTCDTEDMAPQTKAVWNDCAHEWQHATRHGCVYALVLRVERLQTALDKLHSAVKDEYDEKHPLMVMVRAALAGKKGRKHAE